MKNKYYRRSRISPKLFEKVVRNFANDATATQTAALTKISIRSVNTIYLSLRQRIAEELDREWLFVKNNPEYEIKISRRPVQRRCKQNGQKILVLVLSQYEHRVHLEVVPDARKNKPQSLNYKKPIAVTAQDRQAERLWYYLDHRLIMFRGLSEKTFSMHIKETAFRFNHQNNLYQKLLLMLERNPL